MFDKNSIIHLFSKKNFKFIKSDVRYKKIILKEIKNQDYIIPLAALVGAPLCQKYPKKTKEVNLNAIKFIVKNLKKHQRIIYPNTNSGYGIGKKNKFCDENSPLNPISLYGRTKVDAEKVLLGHMNSVVLGSQLFRLFFQNENWFISKFFGKRQWKKKLNIFEPNFWRNYIHVIDVVNAFIFAIKNFNKMKRNIYNVGLSNANLTKLQLAN